MRAQGRAFRLELLQAGPEGLVCFGQDPKTWLLWAGPEDLVALGRTRRLVVTAVAVAEGGRDTRILGDPMDLIRCQNYLAEPTVANSTHKQDKWHCKRSVRQDGETIVIREEKEMILFLLSNLSIIIG